MKSKIHILTLLVLSLLACKQNNTPPDQYELQTGISLDSIQPMTSTMDSLIKKGGGPCVTGSDCMEISVRWPVVKGGDEKIRKILNDSISKFILQNLEYNPELGNISIQQVADTLIAYYALEYKENKAYETGWSMEVNGEIEFHGEIGVLRIYNYSYMGGAHPNHFAQYTNFNMRTGQLIHYSDFVTDTTAFKKIVENKFLAEAAEKAEEEVRLDDFFWGGGFLLPDNFALGEENIELLYNPYEAAAYVYGEFSLEISYDELKGIIDLDALKK